MCSRETILSWLNAELLSLVFGFIISISSGILILVILMVIIGVNLNPPSNLHCPTFTAVMMVILIFVSISFVFSLLLLNGLLKKSPSYVKAYFVYGIIKCILYTIGTIILMVFIPFAGFPILIFCCLYGLFLHFIRLSYCKMTEGSVYNTVDPVPNK